MKKLIYTIFLLMLFLSINTSWAIQRWEQGEGKLNISLKYCDLGTDCIFHPAKEEVLIGTKELESNDQTRVGILQNSDYTCRITQKDQMQPLISSIKAISGSIFDDRFWALFSPTTYVHSEDFVPLPEKEINFDFDRTLTFIEGDSGFISVLIVKSFYDAGSGPYVIRADPNLEVTVNCHKK